MKTNQTPLIFGDVAGNPGGGGRGNVLALFEAMLEAGVQKALVGMLFDPALAAQAKELAKEPSLTHHSIAKKAVPYLEN